MCIISIHVIQLHAMLSPYIGTLILTTSAVIYYLLCYETYIKVTVYFCMTPPIVIWLFFVIFPSQCSSQQEWTLITSLDAIVNSAAITGQQEAL